jgi:16S rRNA (adenine1518-N6/adenine1519-N6)-dimethyltransferase
VAQLTLAQLRQHGIVPDTKLGQHFLVDDNILRITAEMAELGSDDVCYEPGAGVGVLTAFLAERCAHVHSVEVDRRLERALDVVLADHANVTMHWGDAVALNPCELEPAPNKLVSNLPYHVAAPIVAEALQHAPGVRAFVFMVQREVAERMAAAEGGSDYGGLSVLVQTVCERTGLHHVSRAVFAPPPNVDSALVALRRREDGGGVADAHVPAYAAFVKRAFAHRRKTLANNLSGIAGGRERIVEALAAVDRKPAARPQELTPADFVSVFDALERPGVST